MDLIRPDDECSKDIQDPPSIGLPGGITDLRYFGAIIAVLIVKSGQSSVTITAEDVERVKAEGRQLYLTEFSEDLKTGAITIGVD